MRSILWMLVIAAAIWAILFIAARSFAQVGLPAGLAQLVPGSGAAPAICRANLTGGNAVALASGRYTFTC